MSYYFIYTYSIRADKYIHVVYHGFGKKDTTDLIDLMSSEYIKFTEKLLEIPEVYISAKPITNGFGFVPDVVMDYVETASKEKHNNLVESFGPDYDPFDDLLRKGDYNPSPVEINFAPKIESSDISEFDLQLMKYRIMKYYLTPPKLEPYVIRVEGEKLTYTWPDEYGIITNGIISRFYRANGSKDVYLLTDEGFRKDDYPLSDIKRPNVMDYCIDGFIISL